MSPVSIWTFLAVACALSLERLCYAWVWRHADVFRKLCVHPSVAAFGQPVEVLRKLFYGFKGVQLGVFLGWWFIYGQESNSLVSSDIVALGGGAVLIAVGQLLNGMVFYRLGKVGVFYGNKLGHTIPRCHRFPFSVLRHPQYLGAVASIWGFFLATRFPYDDWYLLPVLETVYYAWGAHFEQ